MTTHRRWLLRMLAPKREVVRIDPDHLPGLRAPKSMPSAPLPPDVVQVPTSDIEGMYARFTTQHRASRSRRDCGLGF